MRSVICSSIMSSITKVFLAPIHNLPCKKVAYRSRSFYSIIQEIKNDEDTISDAWVKAQSLSKDVVIITPDALKSAP